MSPNIEKFFQTDEFLQMVNNTSVDRVLAEEKILKNQDVIKDIEMFFINESTVTVPMRSVITEKIQNYFLYGKYISNLEVLIWC